MARKGMGTVNVWPEWKWERERLIKKIMTRTRLEWLRKEFAVPIYHFDLLSIFLWTYTKNLVF